jgi:y4mF family transcriptional regulator
MVSGKAVLASRGDAAPFDNHRVYIRSGIIAFISDRIYIGLYPIDNRGWSMWAQSAAEIGKILATARRHHKLTQAELAQAIGATQAWVSEVEQGKETAQIGKVLRALSHLGVRLRTGVVPWSARKSGTPEPEGVSLSDIIAAHTGSKRSRGKK